MELKEYQKRCLEQVKIYLEELQRLKLKNDKAVKLDPELAFNYPEKAWEKVSKKFYKSKKNGLDEHLPHFCLKVPTGGGKTLLACHAIDLTNRIYLQKQTGLVLWIVPSNQIYRQTLENLSNREHPYRQALDIASGGRTSIIEKTSQFSKIDSEENLLVLLMMLPSTNRQNKESLRVFRDNGGFMDFFPDESEPTKHKALLEIIPNLDFFGDKHGFQGRIVKTSVGNTLRILKPMVIIDEGHKAQSKLAKETIQNLNPSLIVELSATPTSQSNILVNISGRELNQEEMIKLDLRITNKASTDWKDTVNAIVEQRDSLEKTAYKYQSNTGEYIRPIALIQAERTGAKQLTTGFIHAEHVKEHLIKNCEIPQEHIAIKSSDKDDIEGVDLLSRDCPVRYIITKHALQEGWDCAFAYILGILTNPKSKDNITQLVGRVLRQPGARKTKVQALDESYVFCFSKKTGDLLSNIRRGFETEGLGDLMGRISAVTEDEKELKEIKYSYRKQFKKFEGHVYLPKFVIQEGHRWRDLSYEMDILSRIDWSEINFLTLVDIKLSQEQKKDELLKINLSDVEDRVIETIDHSKQEGVLELDLLFVTRQILGSVPNPWIAHEISKNVLEGFLNKHDKTVVVSNLLFITEELKKVLETERDRLAEQVFKTLIQDKELCFFLLRDKGSDVQIPKRIKVKETEKALQKENHLPIQRSLFEFVPEDGFNELEKSVALYLDEQAQLLWWYRNLSRQDYHIQGWKRHRIFPDFVTTQRGEIEQDFSKITVIETKGLHLKNEDTVYKQDVFELCNELGKEVDWRDLNLEHGENPIEFQLIFEDEWKNRINHIFE